MLIVLYAYKYHMHWDQLLWQIKQSAVIVQEAQSTTSKDTVG